MSVGGAKHTFISPQSREASVLWNTLFVAVVVIFIFGAKAVLDGSGVRMATAVVGESAILCAFWALRKGLVDTALQFFFFMSWQSFMGANLTYGGADSLLMAWWVIFVCLAGLIGGQRYTVIWAVISFFSMLFLWAINNWVPSVSELVVAENKAVQLRMHLMAQLAASIAIVQSFVDGTRRYEERILSYTHKLECEVEKRRTAESEAVSSQRSTIQFFANMSHELRTPLNCVIGFSRRLVKRGTFLEDQDALALKRIYSNAQNLSNLVNEMFYLSSLSTAKLQCDPKAFALEGLIQECVTSTDVVARQYGLSVNFTYEESCLIKADKPCLHQAILNLLYFCIRQTKVGQISLEQKRVECEGVEKLHLVISDTSPGISKDQLAHLFETHYECVLEGNKELPISALALVISAKLVALHGGQITAESELEKGTVFTVVLPFEYDKGGSLSG